MKLLDSDVRQFQKLYKKHFNEDIKPDEAREQLGLLVRQMEIVYQPITAEQLDRTLMKYVNESQNHEQSDNN